jgi:hypothetical protein
MAALAKTLTSYDILAPSSWCENANIQAVYDTAEKII